MKTRPAGFSAGQKKARVYSFSSSEVGRERMIGIGNSGAKSAPSSDLSPHNSALL